MHRLVKYAQSIAMWLDKPQVNRLLSK